VEYLVVKVFSYTQEFCPYKGLQHHALLEVSRFITTWSSWNHPAPSTWYCHLSQERWHRL